MASDVVIEAGKGKSLSKLPMQIKSVVSVYCYYF